ncbi:hypothetical protein NO758_04058 [Planktothrix agardhii]|nr:hypothetical protein NO758_04058 [Planktothrix agardhii]
MILSDSIHHANISLISIYSPKRGGSLKTVSRVSVAS